MDFTQTSMGYPTLSVASLCEPRDIERLVFGKDAKDFGGTDWEEELRDVGLL